MTLNSRCFRLTRKGDAFELARGELSVSKPGPTEVMVRLSAASLNYRDISLREHGDGVMDGLIPLSDGAGTVLEVGTKVSKWKSGDRVSPGFFPGWHDGPFMMENRAAAFGGGSADGLLRDLIVVDENSLLEAPDHLSLAETATLPCAGVTAWQALFERGGLQAGHTVLVQGTGGVALFGLQLATAAGARVIVISSSDEKLERAKNLGAWQGVNYKSNPDWDKAVLDMTDRRGVDHVLELGGPDTYDRSIAVLAGGGKLAQIGVLTGIGMRPNLLPLQRRNATIHGISVGSVAHFGRMNAFLTEHKIHPVIDKHFGFEQAPEAYAYLKSAAHFGKVVIDIS